MHRAIWRSDAEQTLARLAARWGWLMHVGVLALAVLVTAFYTLRTDRDFWYDEAMLVQAIRSDGWLLPWQPLSNFEQASPWGVYLIQKAALELVGFQPELLRIPGLLAYAVGGAATWRAARQWLGPGASLLAGVAALASLDVVQSAGDFKHYVFEFAASGVVIWLGARAAREPSARRVAVLVAAGAALVLVSNTIVFVMPGVLAAVWFSARRLRRSVTIGAVVFLVAYGCWYLLAIRPATVYQLAYPTYRQSSTVDVYTAIVQAVAQPDGSYIVSLTGLATAGLAVACVWRRDVLGAFLPAAAAVLLGWVGVRTGIVPFSADRHLLFLVPLVALSAAAAVHVGSWLLRAAVPPVAARAALVSTSIALVVALGAVVTIAPNATLLRQQTGQALTAYEGTCSSFFVDWWSQPMAVLYGEALGLDGRIHGMVSTRSGVGEQAWIYRVIQDPGAYQRRLVAWMSTHPSACLLTVGGASEPEVVFAPLAAAGLDCTELPALTGIHVSRCRRG